MSDPVDTAALRTLADRAEPGPWQAIFSEGDATSNRVDYYTIATESDVEPVAVLYGDGRPEPHSGNAYFIAAARSAVPALCDEVDALRAAVAAPTTSTESFDVSVKQSKRLLAAVRSRTIVSTTARLLRVTREKS